MKKDNFLDQAVVWAKRQGFSDIRANTEEYDSPKSFRNASSNDEFMPDLTGRKLGRKSYVEIALKSEDVRRKVSKWKLLSTLAAMKEGRLFLLAPRGHKAFVDNIVKVYNIEAKVVSI